MFTGTGHYLQSPSLCPYLGPSQVELWRFTGEDVGIPGTRQNVSPSCSWLVNPALLEFWFSLNLTIRHCIYFYLALQELSVYSWCHFMILLNHPFVEFSATWQKSYFPIKLNWKICNVTVSFIIIMYNISLIHNVTISQYTWAIFNFIWQLHQAQRSAAGLHVPCSGQDRQVYSGGLL